MEFVLRVEGAELPRSDRDTKRVVASKRLYGASIARLKFLHLHAGKWCRLAEASGGDRKAVERVNKVAAYLRRHTAFAGCEFKSRTVGGVCVVFGRYVPPANTEAA
jgi:hypothetical protein